MQIIVVSGGDTDQRGIALHTPNRNSKLLSWAKQPFLWEQRFFFLALLPRILQKRPAVIYLGEYRLFAYLSKIRKLLGLKFSLVLYTGGQAIPGQKLFDGTRDYIHHVTPVYLSQCNWVPQGRQWVLPHFFTNDFLVDKSLVTAIKHAAGARKVILSVGLLDFSTKQMDKLLAALSEDPSLWFPVLLGASSADTPKLIQLLQSAFGDDGFMVNEVPHYALGSYYEAADIFVLCSLRESFGLAFVEALYFGLPVVCHLFFESEWVLKEYAHYVDVNDSSALALQLKKLRQGTQKGAIGKEDRKAFAVSNYDWPALEQQYRQLFKSIVANKPLEW